MRRQYRLGTGVVAALVAVLAAGCGGSGGGADVPGLAARGTTLTTVTPTRQDLDNRVSLAGKVTVNPVFGLVAPVSGQIRYLDVKAPTSTPTKPTRVANIWVSGKAHRIEVPAGAVFAGRLVEDRSTVVAGMPVVSARRIGYGLVADIGGGDAYKISESLATVQAQIKNGPGPFPCTVLGTIAALPAGAIPDPPAPPAADPGGTPSAPPGEAAGPRMPGPQEQDRIEPSESTGLRVVCTAPDKVKLINGADVTLQVVTAKAANVLVLPVEAVAGGQGEGKVDVVRPDQTRETRDVVLGLSDGRMVEIKSGLTGDETIAVPGPNLPAAKPAPADVPGPAPAVGK